MSKLSKEAYQNKLNYINEYNKKNATRKVVWFNNTNERDVTLLEYLKTKRSTSEFLKNLIEKDMKGE